MFLGKNLILSGVLATSLTMMGGMTQLANADVRIDIKNESSEDCSVAFNARVDKTKWITVGWYVFVAGEEGPVILKGANDIHDVFIYHDCAMKPQDSDETKEAWIKDNYAFNDDRPMENEEGYSKKEFIRLTSNSFTITGPQQK